MLLTDIKKACRAMHLDPMVGHLAVTRRMPCALAALTRTLNAAPDAVVIRLEASRDADAKKIIEDLEDRGFDVMLKIPPPGSTMSQRVCQLLQDAIYLDTLQTCDLIGDPVLRKQCRADAREAYCDASASCYAV